MSLPSLNIDSLTAYPGTGTTVSGNLPVNTDKQLLFAQVVGVFTGLTAITITPPAGWTAISSGIVDAQGASGRVAEEIYLRVGTGTTASVTWTFSRSADTSQVILGTLDNSALSSWEASSVINAASTSLFVSSATVGPVSTFQDNCLLLMFSAIAGNVGLSSSMTPALDSALNNVEAAIWSDVLGAQGSSGTKTITFGSSGGASVHALVAIRPYAGPSIPELIAPARLGSNDVPPTIIIGVPYQITWAPSASPTAAQSTLKYHIQHSADNGVSWADLVALTSAGASSYSWSTTGLSAGSSHQIRIEANDPATSLNSLAYDYSKPFTLVAEVAPAPPTALSPSGGTVDKSTAATPLSWLHSGGAGNPQTKYTYQWSRDAFASHTATVGPVTSSTQGASKDFSAEADGVTITWRVKTTGLTLDSAYSSNASFVAAVAPAAPNITAPTAGSPPTGPDPTYTFTESSVFTHRRLRLVTGGSQVYDSGFVSGTSLSFPSVNQLANGVAYTAYLSVKNQYGLVSAEDSETFTPTFTGPATPTITVTNDNDGGFNHVQISNAGSPAADYNEIYRFAAGQTSADFIRVGTAVALNGSFDDYNVRSGIQYTYKARAIISATLKFTDSTTTNATVILDRGFLHTVDRG